MATVGQFVEDAGQRIQVGCRRQRRTLEQFGSGVARGPGVDAAPAELRQAVQDACLRLAEAEVEEPHALLAEHHVARLQVAMQHPLFVDIGQGVQQRPGDRAQLGPGQAFGTLAEQAIERQARHEFHDDVGALADGVDVEGEQTHDVRMAQAPGQGELAIEQGAGVG